MKSYGEDLLPREEPPAKREGKKEERKLLYKQVLSISLRFQLLFKVHTLFRAQKKRDELYSEL